MKTLKRILGFTLIELMVALAVAAVLYNAMATYYFQSAQAQKDRANANLHRTIAQAYASYITDNYSAVMTAMSGNLAVIPYSALPSQYKTGITVSSFLPCALILKDSSGKVLFPLIVDVTNTSYVPTSKAAVGANYLGDYAAYLDGTIYKSNSGWSINTNTSPYFAALSSCDYPNLVQKSLAINLVMAPFFMQPNSDLSLNRVKDPYTIGSNNKNVEKSDIELGYPSNPTIANRYNRIIFNDKALIANPPYCASGLGDISPYNISSNIICRNSTIRPMAMQSVVANSAITIGSACATNDLGKLYVESALPNNNDPRSNLVCSYNPVMCTLMNGNVNRTSCYLSTSTETKTWSNPTLPTLAAPTCAAMDPNAPIAIAAEANKAIVVVRQALCRISSGSSGTRCGTGGATQTNIAFQYTGLSGSQNLLTSIVPNGTSISGVYIGATAPTSPATALSAIPIATSQPLTNNNCGNSSTCCTQVCTNLYGTTTASWSTSRTIDCYCSIGASRGVEIRSVYRDTLTNNTNIKSLTCTNKTVFR